MCMWKKVQGAIECSALENQKRALAPLELQLQVV